MLKLIVGVQQGIVKFPKDIWDVTKKKENMIPMTQEQFYGLIAILEQAQSKAFDVRKNKQSDLINEKEALLKQLEN